MPDRMTPEQRHYCMSQIRSEDTKPEMAVRRALFARGFRYRLHVHSLPGSPDIAIAKYRTAIFINGCFWHGHAGCDKFVLPKTNSGFWKDKIERNRKRDALNVQRLELLLWNVIIVWECELSPACFEQTMARVVAEIRSNRAKCLEYKAKRRLNRIFAREQAQRHREIMAQVKAELTEQFNQNPT